MMKGINASDKNSAFVWSNYGEKNFENIPELTENMIVVITNCKNARIHVYDVSDMNKNEERALVTRHCTELTSGCDYTWKIVRHIGNTYFCE